MPLYEYRCEACGQPEEKLESLSAPEAHACPACGGYGLTPQGGDALRVLEMQVA